MIAEWINDKIAMLLFQIMFRCAKMLFPHVAILTGDDDAVKGIVMTANPITGEDDISNSETTLTIDVQ